MALFVRNLKKRKTKLLLNPSRRQSYRSCFGPWRSRLAMLVIVGNAYVETELIVLVSTSEEVGWLRELLLKMPIWDKRITPVLLYCGSTTIINWVHNMLYPDPLGENTVVWAFTNGTMNIGYVRTIENITNLWQKIQLDELFGIHQGGWDLSPRKNQLPLRIAYLGAGDLEN